MRSGWKEKSEKVNWLVRFRSERLRWFRVRWFVGEFDIVGRIECNRKLESKHPKDQSDDFECRRKSDDPPVSLTNTIS